MAYHFEFTNEDGDIIAYYPGSPEFDDLNRGPLSSFSGLSSFTLPEGAELVGVESYALSPITSSSGLKGVLLDVLGPYDNIVTQYQYRQNTSTNYSYVNEITPDYPWIASAALFIVLLWSLFGLLRRGIWTK